MKLKQACRVVLAFVAIVAAGFTVVQAAGPGQCGPYKFWRDGQCVDARAEGQKSWSDRMSGQSKWW
jgi:hypothetical protein